MEKTFFPEEIFGERVVLRRHQAGLAQTMFEYVNKDRARLRVYLPWVDAIKTAADEAKYIEFANESWSKFTLFDFGIFRKSDNVYMGNVGVHSIEWKSEVCELGYWILGDFEGQGYVSEAVRALERACFSLGFERIEIRCSSVNFRSAAVPMRCGYTMEGCLRSNGCVNGKRVNTFVFSKLKGEAD
jgi:ribosomal-protein-serine acetyltransferase